MNMITKSLIVLLSFVILGEIFLYYKVTSTSNTAQPTPEKQTFFRYTNNFETNIKPKLQKSGVLIYNKIENNLVHTEYKAELVKIESKPSGTFIDKEWDYDTAFYLKTGENDQFMMGYNNRELALARITESDGQQTKSIRLNDLHEGDLLEITTTIDIAKSPPDALISLNIVRIVPPAASQ